MRVNALAVVVLVLWASVACERSPKSGKSCKIEGAATCEDQNPRVMLVCQDGKWQSYTCGWETALVPGFTKTPDGAKCDFSGAEPGAACAPAYEGKQLCGLWYRVSCTGGLISRELCRGAKGCRVENGATECDTSISVFGSDCAKVNDKKYACSPDGESRLQCLGGKWTVDIKCGGRGGCTVKDNQVLCDQMVVQGDESGVAPKATSPLGPLSTAPLSPVTKQLFDAVLEQRDLAAGERAIKAGADVNAGIAGQTLLMKVERRCESNALSPSQGGGRQRAHLADGKDRLARGCNGRPPGGSQGTPRRSRVTVPDHQPRSHAAPRC